MSWGSAIVILAAVAASAFFSGSETGLVSVSRIRLKALAASRGAAARSLNALLDRKERTLTAILIGNNIAMVGASATATAIAEGRMGSAGPLVATVLVTLVLLIFGEMVPKAYFRIKADTAMLYAARPLMLVCFVLRPVVDVASFFTSLLFLALRSERKGPVLTREDVRLVLKESGQAGVLGAREREMLEGAMDLRSTVAREVMIPLPDVVSIPEDATVEDVKRVLRWKNHTRYPVYRRRVDRIVGVLNVFDLLFSDRPLPPGTPVRGFVRDLPVVPETKRIDVLLFELQRDRDPMAVIVNEYGACIGIVTVEDIVEEIMGEIADEHERPEQKVTRLDDGSYLVDARIDIDDLNDELGLRLPKERYDTLGGLVMKRLGRIPTVGETVTVGKVRFEVRGVHKFGIRTIRAVLAADENGERDGGGTDA